MTPALAMLNNLLKDDIMDDGYILHISIYVRYGLEQNTFSVGRHKRVRIYREVPNYRSIISLETSGELIKRLPNTCDQRGETLVMISATDSLRDHVRDTIRENLPKGVTLSEQEYQPMMDSGLDQWYLKRINGADVEDTPVSEGFRNEDVVKPENSSNTRIKSNSNNDTRHSEWDELTLVGSSEKASRLQKESTY
ncbi:hypothetical protein CBS147347_11448 [Aspergillus niger]|nr:hypothetical protein CBS147347_11448 [Aspergillus niger]